MLTEEERDQRENPSGFGSLLHLAISLALGASFICVCFWLGYKSI